MKKKILTLASVAVLAGASAVTAVALNSNRTFVRATETPGLTVTYLFNAVTNANINFNSTYGTFDLYGKTQLSNESFNITDIYANCLTTVAFGYDHIVYLKGTGDYNNYFGGTFTYDFESAYVTDVTFSYHHYKTGDHVIDNETMGLNISDDSGYVYWYATCITDLTIDKIVITYTCRG